MQIAQQLHRQNIVEYLLYMWQMEDLIRAYGCSLARIQSEYIAQFELTDEQREEEVDWFGSLISMMNQEGKREKGHLQINCVTMQALSELHAELLQSTKFPFYNSEYYRVLPYIVELRNKGDKQVSEIETCLSALYGIMLLRMKHESVSASTESAIKEITTFVGMLADYYKKDKEEGLEL